MSELGAARFMADNMEALAQFRKNEVVANNIVRRLRMDDTLEMTEQIKALKETAQYLNERIDGLEAKLREKKEEGFKLWEPEQDGVFYWIDWDSEVKPTSAFMQRDFRRKLIESGNAYKTQKIALTEKAWFDAARNLRALARELGGGFVHKDYFVICRRPDDTLYIDEIYSKHSVSEVARFKTREAAQTALDNLTEDEREVLFG